MANGQPLPLRYQSLSLSSLGLLCSVISQGPSKKRKLAPNSRSSVKSHANLKGKAKKQGSNRDTIPIPLVGGSEDEDIDSSEQDLEIFGSASFLNTLDHQGIARYETDSIHVLFSIQRNRSKQETERLHRLTQPTRKGRVSAHDDLPSIHSHDEDEDSWNSDMAEDPFGTSDTEDTLSDQDSQSSLHDSDDEMPYETNPRIRRPSWDIEDKPAIKRLPIKLADGHIRQTGVHFSALQHIHSDDANERQQPEEKASQDSRRVEDVSTGARFGRAAIVDVVGIQSQKERIQRAKEQIAGICQEILSDPENNVSCIKCIRTDYLFTQ